MHRFVPSAVLIIIIVILSAPATSAALDPPRPLRPNIIFIFSDDHGAQAISAYGSKINRTPNIDRLAREGMLFENCFCTNAICGPSRAVILTGKHSHINGFATNWHSFDSTQPTFPKMLQQAGYQTAIFGKWHLKSDPVGFDHWEVLPGQGDYYNPTFRIPGGTKPSEGYVADLVTHLAIDWLGRKRDADKPFMLMVQHKAPHRPWLPGPEHLTMYDDVEIPEPPTLFDEYEGRGSPAREQEMTIAQHMSLSYDLQVEPEADEESATGLDKAYYSQRNRMTPEQREKWDAAFGPKNEAFRSANLEGDDLVRWKYQRYAKNYLRCVASVDDNVGLLLDVLDRTGLAENTVVIYSSDQGWYIGEHGWYDKRWMYEESLRMPLIVRWPGVVEAGSRDAHLVQNLDFAQTFLDIAGAPIADGMQGASLVPFLRGEGVAWRDAIYYHYYEHPAVHMVARHYGVRTDRYKLIHFYRKDEWEMYDLERDPDELHSVHDDPAYAEVRAGLEAKLAELRELYGESEATDLAFDQMLDR